MALTVKKVAKVSLNVATHPSFTAGDLAAGTYDFNITEFLPKGALVTGIKAVEGTSLAGGTSIALVVNQGTPQALTAAIDTANWAGVTSPALDADTDGEVVTVGANLGFTTVGDFTAGTLDVYFEFVY